MQVPRTDLSLGFVGSMDPLVSCAFSLECEHARFLRGTTSLISRHANLDSYTINWTKPASCARKCPQSRSIIDLNKPSTVDIQHDCINSGHLYLHALSIPFHS